MTHLKMGFRRKRISRNKFQEQTCCKRQPQKCNLETESGEWQSQGKRILEKRNFDKEKPEKNVEKGCPRRTPKKGFPIEGITRKAITGEIIPNERRPRRKLKKENPEKVKPEKKT